MSHIGGIEGRRDIMWYELETKNDIAEFMERFYDFHDSCIKELKYVSGAYVNKNLSMWPINEQRIVRMVIQRQFSDPSAIEMEFIGLERLYMVPVNPKFTCEIFNAGMFMREGIIWWCNDGDLSEDELLTFDAALAKTQHLPYNLYDADADSHGLTLIGAERVRWRPAETYIGQDEVYSSLNNEQDS